MTRKIAWSKAGDYFAEYFIIEGLDGHKADWVMHIGGELENKAEMPSLDGALSTERPLKHMKDIQYLDKPQQAVCSRFSVDGINVYLHSWVPDGTLYLGHVPDNPSIKDISQVVERKTGDKAVFLHLIETCRENAACHSVQMSLKDGKAVIEFNEQLEGNTVPRKIVF